MSPLGSAWLLGLLGVVPAAGGPPSVEGELNALHAALARLDRYAVSVNVTHFPSTDAERPDFERTIAVKRLDDTVLIDDADRRVLSSPRQTIVVDKRRARILYNAGSSPATREALQPASVTESLAAAMRRGDVFRHLGTDPQGIHLVADSDRGPIRRTEVFIDPKTHFLSRITYVYRAAGQSPEMRAEIRYEWGRTDEVRPADFLPESYVRYEGTDVRPSGTYAQYELVRLDRDQ